MASGGTQQTVKTAIKQAQEACKSVPCARIDRGQIGCPFCPHYVRDEYK